MRDHVGAGTRQCGALNLILADMAVRGRKHEVHPIARRPAIQSQPSASGSGNALLAASAARRRPSAPSDGLPATQDAARRGGGKAARTGLQSSAPVLALAGAAVRTAYCAAYSRTRRQRARRAASLGCRTCADAALHGTPPSVEVARVARWSSGMHSCPLARGLEVEAISYPSLLAVVAHLLTGPLGAPRPVVGGARTPPPGHLRGRGGAEIVGRAGVGMAPADAKVEEGQCGDRGRQ